MKKFTSLCSSDYVKLLSLFIMLFAFLGFGFCLDRYPPFYVDEPFFNYPSISYLGGNGFVYRHSPDTPHGDLLWAYNGPFFSRLQCLTFTVFGRGLANWRWPQYLCGFLSIGLLSFHLIENGRPISGVLMPMVWAGDGTLMQLLLGRPDGIALLFIVIAFLLLIQVGRSYSAWATWAAGLCVGIACGFHFTAAPFVFAAALTLAFTVPIRRLPGALVCYALGGLVPLIAILWIWTPHVKEAFEQLMWHVRLPMGADYGARVVNLFHALGWSRFWVVGLLIGWLVSGALVVKDFCPRRPHWKCEVSRYDNRLLLASFLFGSAGVAVLFTPRALYPYYLIYFSCWPVVGLLSRLKGDIPRGGWRPWMVVFSMALVAAWVPSFAWNLTRFREAVIYYSALDHSNMIAVLRSVVPVDAKICAEPELISAAVEAKLSIDRPQWAHSMDHPSEAAFLLMSESGYTRYSHSHPSVLADRKIVYRGGTFPGAGPLDFPIVVMTPTDKRL